MARRGKKKSKPSEPQQAKEKRQPRTVEHVADSEDEEIPEDEAFNSEDERLYGHFFTKKDDDEDEATSDDEDDDDDDEDDDDDDSGDDDDDGGQYMLDLLDKIDASRKKDDGTSHMANVPESEYSSSISKKGLTLDNLMEGLQDTQGFRKLQKTFEKQETATPAPLEKVKADRTQRKMAYKEQAKEIARWTKAVQENRQAETLDFKSKDRTNLTRDALVDKFEPTTEFEKQLEEALEEAGQQDEEAVLKAEEQALQDDLGANRLTMEEYKKRRGQLAQVRALMFYHESKRHKMKKIKSKKYRRIRKRQRERLKESALEDAMQDDEELANELKEKEEVARIQERMTLAHKNTSKWAKRILKRGKNVDVDTRRALSAQLKRGDDLRKKMMGDDEGSENDSDEDLVESARKVLTEMEDADDPTGGKTGLFKLSFMQKGIQKQREKAKEEARRLLTELESNEKDDYDDLLEDDSEDKSERKKEKIASEKEMKHVLQKGELVASSLEFGNSTAIATSSGIQIDLGSDDNDSKTPKKGSKMVSGTSEHSSTMVVKTDHTHKGKPSPEKKAPKGMEDNKAKEVKTKVAAEGDEEENPWMVAEDTNEDAQTSTKKKRKSRGMVDVEGAVDILDAGKIKDVPDHREARSDDKESKLGDDGGNKKLTMLSQEELVRRAFATTDDKEIEEEFQKEKQAMIEETDPTRKREKELAAKEVSGWGSWAGAGAPPPFKKKVPKKLQAPMKKEDPNSRKRKDEYKPNVIINQKRLKKMANTFMLADVPHPYSTRAEYEQAMLGGVGKEWNVTGSFKQMTRPEILTRSGKIIQPISKKAKVARPAAKF